jgi:hypothetical protein
MEERKIKIAYRPRAIQRELHDAIDAGFKHVMLVWHRRAGKTVSNVNQLIKSTMKCPLPNPRFAYVAPFYRQAKAIAWDYLQTYSRPIPGISINKSELAIDYPNGGRVQLFGADNPDALRGLYLDGVVLDEYAQIHPLLRKEVLLAALSDRKGWEVVCGTPKGRNQFYQLYAGDSEYVGATNDPDWKVLLRRVVDTDVFTSHEQEQLLRAMGHETYAQEFMCDWRVADRGNYYAAILERLRQKGRFGRDMFDPGLVVHTAWDLGIGDATAIWFIQTHGPEVRHIDYYEAEGEALAHYVGVLQAKQKERRFNYGKHLVPHDADHRTMQTGKTLVQMARELGVVMTTVPVGDFDAGIEATRQVLERSWFDADRCKAGISALDAYRRTWHARIGAFGDEAVHDWASHGADAERCFATAQLGSKLTPRMFPGQAPRFARMD